MNETELPKELAWMPLYWDKFLSATTYFDGAEIGAYILLLSYQWKNGCVPSDIKQLQKIARVSKNKLKIVLTKFTSIGDDKLINKVCDEIRTEQLKKYEKTKEKASNASKKRWNSGADTFQKSSLEDATSISQASEKPQNDEKKTCLGDADNKIIEDRLFTKENRESKHIPAKTFYDLEYFEKSGFTVSVGADLKKQLNEFLKYRSDHPEHGAIKSHYQVEGILKGFMQRKINEQAAVKMLEYTIERGAKNVIYELPKNTTDSKTETPKQKFLD
jgi:uncharacterized protein YdaU (DUF1376 family)